MESSELAIPAYLNQASIFDLLSIVQDGFSTVKTIKSSTSQDSKNDISVEANAESNLGVKNIFSLLFIGIKGKYEHIGEKTKQDEEQFEKVYTPTSLFWRLRDYLVKNELIKRVVFEEGEIKVKAGEFIEFEGKFEKNPLIESIENIQKLIDLVYVLSPETLETETRSNPGGGKTPKHLPGKKPAIIDQIDVFAKSLKLDDTIDLIADDDINGIKMIVTCDINYFVNGNSNRVIDGKYKVLGKVVNYVSESNESINLLRSTALSKFKKETLDGLFSGFSAMGESGLNMPEIKTEIVGPCIQIIPIGIFV